MFDFEAQLKKAPEEVKTKMAAASMAQKRYRLAMKQVDLWSKEQTQAAQSLSAAQEDWNEVLNRWDPETGALVEKQLAPGFQS